jgi:hypothetical protein
MKMDLKRAVRLSGAIIAACIVALLVDYGVATNLAPKDDKLIKDLQTQTKADSAFAPKLAAEQKRVTNRRLGRNRRDNAIAWMLIAVAAVFLTGAKRLVGSGRVEWGRPPGLRPTLPSASGRRPARGPAADQGVCPTPLDLAFVDEIAAELGRGKEAAIPLLQAIQTHYRYLPDEALRRLCEITDITPAEISGTSSFYGQFRRSPVGEHVVRV